MNSSRDSCECPRCGDIDWRPFTLATNQWNFLCNTCLLHLNYALRESDLRAENIDDYFAIRQRYISEGIKNWLRSTEGWG